MASRDGSHTPGGTGAAVDRITRAASGAATVEIAGFPQTLYVRMFGEPDTLFVPLLDAVREAFGLVEKLSGQAESRANALSLCAMHLASSLLRDNHFSLGARGLSPENSYSVNFETGTLHVIAQLYSVVNRRTSFFKVELAGNIAGGSFAVREPRQGTVIMQVEEEKLRQPHFFTSDLPNECVRALMDRERFGSMNDGSEVSRDMRMVIEVAGRRVPVVLRPRENQPGWDVLDGRQQQQVASLSPEMTAHLTALQGFVRGLFDR